MPRNYGTYLPERTTSSLLSLTHALEIRDESAIRALYAIYAAYLRSYTCVRDAAQANPGLSQDGDILRISQDNRIWLVSKLRGGCVSVLGIPHYPRMGIFSVCMILDHIVAQDVRGHEILDIP